MLRPLEAKGVLAKAGLDAQASTPAESADVLHKDFTRWGAVIQRNGMKAD